MAGESRFSSPFFMARQSKKFYVQFDNSNHRLSGWQYARLVAAGFAIVIEERLARLRKGVQAELRCGELWVCDPNWLYTSWISIDRMAPVRGEYYKKQLERDHCVPKGVRVEPYTETRTRMIGWKGTADQLRQHVEQMRASKPCLTT